jgi:5-methyltetrahydropteroyltriglutamate--homocysteine methyltransferase
MLNSSDRIITTHAGSLPRPPELVELIFAKARGEDYDAMALVQEIDKAVVVAVARQGEIGIDIPTDGEMSKESFLNYITDRLEGVTVTDEMFGNPWAGSKENNDWPEYYGPCHVN